jgi:hypothetical protein
MGATKRREGRGMTPVFARVGRLCEALHSMETPHLRNSSRRAHRGDRVQLASWPLRVEAAPAAECRRGRSTQPPRPTVVTLRGLRCFFGPTPASRV